MDHWINGAKAKAKVDGGILRVTQGAPTDAGRISDAPWILAAGDARPAVADTLAVAPWSAVPDADSTAAAPGLPLDARAGPIGATTILAPAPVPVPAAGYVLIAGIGALLLLRRRMTG